MSEYEADRAELDTIIRTCSDEAWRLLMARGHGTVEVFYRPASWPAFGMLLPLPPDEPSPGNGWIKGCDLPASLDREQMHRAIWNACGRWPIMGSGR